MSKVARFLLPVAEAQASEAHLRGNRQPGTDNR